MILNRGTEKLGSFALSQVNGCGSYLVESVTGPEQHRLRLCEMGIVAGAPLSVIACPKEGMLVVKVGGSRIGLSRETVEYIQVQKSLSQ